MLMLVHFNDENMCATIDTYVGSLFSTSSVVDHFVNLIDGYPTCKQKVDHHLLLSEANDGEGTRVARLAVLVFVQ